MATNSSKPHGNFLASIVRAIGLCLLVAVLFFVANYVVVGGILLYRAGPLPALALQPAVQNGLLAAAVFSLMLALVFGVERLMSGRVELKRLSALRGLPRFSDIGLGLLGLIPAFIGAALLTALALVLFPSIDVSQAQDVGFGGIAVRYEYVIAFLTLVVIAPLAEEIVFRGYLYTKLRAHSGVIVSTLLVSLTFAALHLQVNVAISVFALSLVLCGLREYTGTIWASLLLHAFKNAIAYYFLFVSPILLQ